MEAVEAVPWGPRYGIRVKFRRDTKGILVPEVVRPLKLNNAVEKEGPG